MNFVFSGSVLAVLNANRNTLIKSVMTTYEIRIRNKGQTTWAVVSTHSNVDAAEKVKAKIMEDHPDLEVVMAQDHNNSRSQVR